VRFHHAKSSNPSLYLPQPGAASSPPVTFESPCECRANHGEHRWVVKKIRRLRPQMPAQFSQ